jgi:glycosyltransferase involved in cell wall biosynthesis
MDLNYKDKSKISDPKVVVIMPTYNGEKYLGSQIQSILVQTHAAFALHVFDDCSDDQTVSIVKEYAQRDHRVHLHKNPQQLGVIQNISKALSAIEADVYFLSDQDDIWLPEKMMMQLEALYSEEALLTFTNLELVNDTGDSMGIDFWSSQNIDPSEASTPEYIAIKTMVTGCTMAFKKELLDIALPIPPEATMHDHWLSFFAAVKGKVLPISKTLVKYRQHASNVIGGMTDPYEIRRKRYDGCQSYRDFKERKHSSYIDMQITLEAFKKRIELHKLDQTVLDKYIDFYDSLVHHHWCKSFWIAAKLEKIPHTHSFIRTALVAAFFPLFFIYMKVFRIGE